MNKRTMNENYKKGFAALMTVIIVSGIISALIFPVVLQSHLGEESALEKLFKIESRLAANSCVSALILLIKEFGAGAVPDCTIHSVRVVGNNRIIEVESKVGNSHTLLRATINMTTNKISFLEELARF